MQRMEIAETETERQFFRRSGPHTAQASPNEDGHLKPKRFTLLLMVAIMAIGVALMVVANSGCSSPPDNCSEVDKCDGDVDGSTPDQPDSNTTDTDGGQTQPDGGNTNVCATYGWMEDPEMFDCDYVDTSSGEETPGPSCNPLLINGSNGCEVRCVDDFWATPEQLTINTVDHSFEVKSDPEAAYPSYRCYQRL